MDQPLVTAASSDSDSLLRFHVALQKSRAAIYTATWVIGYAAIRTGVMHADLFDCTLLVVTGILSAVAIWLRYKHGRGQVAGIELGWIGLWFDVGLITWGVYISGGWTSPWFLFYLANASGAAFLGGRGAWVADQAPRSWGDRPQREIK